MSEDASRVQQAGQTAKEQASSVAGRTAQAGGEVAGTAAEQVRAVVGEARAQAGGAMGDLRQRAAEEGQGQVERLSGTVRKWADDLAGLADGASQDSPARGLAAQAADRGHRAADYLDKSGLEGLVGDLQDFARRRPGVFLGGAVLAGLAVGRLAKAGTKAAQAPSASHQVTPAPSAPYQDASYPGLEPEESSGLPTGVPVPPPEAGMPLSPPLTPPMPPEPPGHPTRPGV